MAPVYFAGNFEEYETSKTPAGNLLFFSVFLILSFLFATNSVQAQAPGSGTLQAERTEAAALLKRLQKYEKRYLASESSESSQAVKTISARPQATTRSIQSSPESVYNQQQERLIGEILTLRKKVNRLESEAEQAVESIDFSQREQELVNEIRIERKRAEDFENDLEEFKRAENRERLLKKALSDQQGLLAVERKRAQKRAEEIEELNSEIEDLKIQLQRRQTEGRKLAEVRNKAQSLQLKLESRGSVETDNQYLRTELEEVKGALQLALKEKNALAQSVANQNEQISALLDKEQTLSSTLKTTVAHVKQESQDLESSQMQIAELQQMLSAEQTQRKHLEEQVNILHASAEENSTLKGQLLAAKNELLLKNTAAELIGKGPSRKQREVRKRARMLAKAQSGSSVNSSTAESAKALETMKAFEAAQRALQGSTSSPQTQMMTSNKSDVLIVEVQGAKVNLRGGPGTEHSPLMQVAEGTRLTVESRQGEWLRVFTPTGGRAFVREDMVKSLSSQLPQIPQAIGAVPSKPAVQSIAPETSLVPFGRVKVAGSESRDLEDAALNMLKGLGK